MTPKTTKPEQTQQNRGPLLGKIAYAWDNLEPSILGWIVGELPFILRGTHGNAKSTVAKVVALALAKDNAEDSGIRFIPCDKSTMINIAGIPSKELTEKFGDIRFIPSHSTVIGDDVTVLILDELTRAIKESQNFFLEIIENKTVFGIQLHYKQLIATMNPDTYKGAIKLDAALLDRFVGALPVDDLSEIEAEGVKSIVAINMNRAINPNYDKEIAVELRERLALIKAQYDKMIASEETRMRVSNYCEQFCTLVQPILKGSNSPILSGREIGRLLWRSIISIGAYYVTVYGWGEGQSLIRAAEETIKYAVIFKHQLPSDVDNRINSVHVDCQFILSTSASGKGGALVLEFARSITGTQKVEFWRKNIDAVCDKVDAAEQAIMMNGTIAKIEEMQKDKKVSNIDIIKTKADLYSIVKPKSQFYGVSNKIEGSMISALISMMQEKVVNPEREPYATVLGKDSIQATEIIDLIVTMQTGNIDLPVH